MPYTLETARTELKRSTPWLTRSVDREPLDGLYDGVNPVFHMPITPMNADDAVTIYSTAGAALTGYTVANYDYGTVVFSSGSIPATAVYGSYTSQVMPDSKLLDLCKAGFDEMESRYTRGYQTIASGGYNYVSSEAASVVDPVVGTSTFSQSRAQVDFLLSCIEYRLAKALYTEAAMSAMSYREERVGGLMVDTSKRAAAFKDLLDEINGRIAEKMIAADAEVTGGSNYGEFVDGAKSDQYVAGYEWYPTSDQALGG